MAEAEQKGRQETRDRLGEVVNRPEADHPDDHGTPRIDAGDVCHPEVRGGTRQHDQADLVKHILAIPDYVMDSLDGPDQVCEPLSKTGVFIVREYTDNPSDHPAMMYLNKGPDKFVDRNCAVLDGNCDCPNTGGSVPNACKYLRDPLPLSKQSDEELFAWINENPRKFDGVIERRIELEAREIMRNLDKD